MLSVIMLSIIMLSVIMPLSGIMPCVIILSDIMLNVIMLSVINLTVIMLKVITLSYIMLWCSVSLAKRNYAKCKILSVIIPGVITSMLIIPVVILPSVMAAQRRHTIEIGLEQAPIVFFLIWTCKKTADYGPQQH